MTEIKIIQVFQSALLYSITGPDLKQYYSWTKMFFFSHPTKAAALFISVDNLAFTFDYLFTLLYIPYSVYPCFPEYCRYFINIVFAKNCIKIKGIIPRLEEADFVYRYSWFITRYKNFIYYKYIKYI